MEIQIVNAIVNHQINSKIFSLVNNVSIIFSAKSLTPSLHISENQ